MFRTPPEAVGIQGGADGPRAVWEATQPVHWRLEGTTRSVDGEYLEGGLQLPGGKFRSIEPEEGLRDGRVPEQGTPEGGLRHRRLPERTGESGTCLPHSYLLSGKADPGDYHLGEYHFRLLRGGEAGR